MTSTVVDIDLTTVDLTLSVEMPSVDIGIPGVPGPPGLRPDEVIVHASGGDDLAALQAAAAFPGTTIVLPDALYLLSAQWHIDQNNVQLVGGGAVGAGATVIRRSTAGAGAVIRWGVPASMTTPIGGTYINGGGARGISIDANGVADYALHVCVADRLIFDDVWLLYADVACLYMNVLSNAGALDNYNRNGFCRFDNVRAYLQTSGFTLNPATAKGFVIAGNATNTAGGQNTYACVWSNCYVEAPDVGVQVLDADDLAFFALWANGSYGVELAGSNGVAHARNVHFYGGIAGGIAGSVIARATGLTSPSRDNTWTVMGNEDSAGALYPVIERGAGFRFTRADGASTAYPDPRTLAVITDEFVGGITSSGNIGDKGWTISGNAPSFIPDAAGHPGVRALQTSGVGTNLNALSLPGLLLLPSEDFEAWFIFSGVSGANAGMRIGFLDAAAATLAATPQGIFLEKQFADTNWFAVTRDGSGTTRTDIGKAASGSWHHLRIKRLSTTRIGIGLGPVNDQSWGGSTATFWSKVNATNIPTVNLMPVFQLHENGGTGVQTNYVDHFQLVIKGMSRT